MSLSLMSLQPILLSSITTILVFSLLLSRR